MRSFFFLEKLRERRVLLDVCHFFVGHRKVHEEFSHEIVEVGHTINFLYVVSDVLEKFMELIEGENRLFCINFCCREFFELSGDGFGFGQVLFEVDFIFLHEHLVALGVLNEFLHILDTTLLMLSLCGKSFDTTVGFFALFYEDFLHLRDVAFVSFTRSQRIFVEEGIGGLHDELGAHRLTFGFAVDGVAAVIKVVLGAAREFLRCDTCGHGATAMTANNHAAHEVGFYLASRSNDLGELVVTSDAFIATDAFKICHVYRGNKVIFLKEVHDSVPENHGTRIERVAHEVRDKGFAET